LTAFLLSCLTLAEAAPGGAAPGSGSQAQPDGFMALVQMLGLLLPLGLVFWLLVWRPESKRRKEREQLLNAVKVKDRVITVGGIHGTVLDIQKDEVTLLVDARKDVRLRFRRSAIDFVEPTESEEKPKQAGR